MLAPDAPPDGMRASERRRDHAAASNDGDGGHRAEDAVQRLRVVCWNARRLRLRHGDHVEHADAISRGGLGGPVDVVVLCESGATRGDPLGAPRGFRMLSPPVLPAFQSSQELSGGVLLAVREELFRSCTVEQVRVPWDERSVAALELRDQGLIGGKDRRHAAPPPGDNLLALRVSVPGAVDECGNPVAPTLVVGIYLRPTWGSRQLPSRGTANEVTLLALMLLLEEHRDCEVLLCGDLNVDPWSAAHGGHWLAKRALNQLRDSFWLVPVNGSPVDVSAGADGRPAKTRLSARSAGYTLDLMLASGFWRGGDAMDQPEALVHNPRVLRFAVGSAHEALSDHCPVMASLYMGRSLVVQQEQRGPAAAAAEPVLRFRPLIARGSPRGGGRGSEAYLEVVLDRADAKWLSWTAGIISDVQRCQVEGQPRAAPAEDEDVRAARERSRWSGDGQSSYCYYSFMELLLRAWKKASTGREGVSLRQPYLDGGSLEEELRSRNPKLRQLVDEERELVCRVQELSLGAGRHWERRECWLLRRRLVSTRARRREMERRAETRLVSESCVVFEANSSDPSACRKAWGLLNRLRKPATVGALAAAGALSAEQHKEFQSELGERAARRAEEMGEGDLLEPHRRSVREAVRGGCRVVNPKLDGDITLEEVRLSLEKMKSWKSPGEDGLVAYCLKTGSRTAVWLTELFNVFLATGCVPKELRTGVVIPILKKGQDESKPESFRPITLQSVVIKCFEGVLNNRGLAWAEEEGLLSPNQYAFRKGKGTEHALMHVLATVDMTRHDPDPGRRRDVYALFGDVQKAYDEVCHDRLFSLLLEHGCCGRWWFLVRALYQGATRRVRCGGVMSSSWEVQAGVMQGSVLSPLLFILYINVLATSLEGQGLGVTVAGRQTCVVLYADDVVLLADRAQDLCALTTMAERALHDIFLRLSAAKSKVVVFRRRKGVGRLFGANLPTLEGVPVQEVPEMRYLGVPLRGQGSLKHVLEERVAALKRARGAVVGNLFCGRLQLGWSTLHKVIFPLVFSAVGYAAQVLPWTRGLLQGAESVQRRLMSQMLGFHPKLSMVRVQLLEAELGMLPLATFLDQMVLRFARSLASWEQDSFLGHVADQLLRCDRLRDGRHPWGSVPWVKRLEDVAQRMGLQWEHLRCASWALGDDDAFEVALDDVKQGLEATVGSDADLIQAGIAEERVAVELAKVRWARSPACVHRIGFVCMGMHWRQQVKEAREEASAVGGRMLDHYMAVKAQEPVPSEKRGRLAGVHSVGDLGTLPAPALQPYLHGLSGNRRLRELVTAARFGALPLLSYEVPRALRLCRDATVPLAGFPNGMRFAREQLDEQGWCLFCAARDANARSREDVLHVVCSCPMYHGLRKGLWCELKRALHAAYPSTLGRQEVSAGLAELDKELQLPWRDFGLGGRTRAHLLGPDGVPPARVGECVGSFVFGTLRRLWKLGHRKLVGIMLLVGDEHPLLRVWAEAAWKAREERRRAVEGGRVFRPCARLVRCVLQHSLAKFLLEPGLRTRERALRLWTEGGGARVRALESLRVDELEDQQREFARRHLFPNCLQDGYRLRQRDRVVP